jgi:hypothetical protein
MFPVMTHYNISHEQTAIDGKVLSLRRGRGQGIHDTASTRVLPSGGFQTVAGFWKTTNWPELPFSRRRARGQGVLDAFGVTNGGLAK